MPQSYAFEIAAVYAPLLALAGVTRDRAVVEVGSDRLLARFGFFRVETAVSNIVHAVVRHGPFSPLKAIGVRYSFEDGSVTFGSSTGPMVEIAFDRPVTVRPPGITRHPALWVSVADPHGLRQALAGPAAGSLHAARSCVAPRSDGGVGASHRRERVRNRIISDAITGREPARGHVAHDPREPVRHRCRTPDPRSAAGRVTLAQWPFEARE